MKKALLLSGMLYLAAAQLRAEVPDTFLMGAMHSAVW